MTEFTPVPALVGGVLIGLSGALMLLAIGRIAGVSGILGMALSRPADGAWRWFFLVGLVAGTCAYAVMPGVSVTISNDAGGLVLALGGLLVGVGTRMGGGCTSGHGVCGLSRFSRRSMVAVPIFMASAGIVVFVSRHVLGGGL